MGLLYGDQLADGLVQGRYTSAFWHASGLYWYDVYGGPSPRRLTDREFHRMSARDGITTLGDRALVVHDGGYLLLEPGEYPNSEHVRLYRAPGCKLQGKPTVIGTRLFVVDRMDGAMSVLDIADLTSPTLIAKRHLPGNPGRVQQHGSRIVVPAGHAGLLVGDLDPLLVE